MFRKRYLRVFLAAVIILLNNGTTRALRDMVMTGGGAVKSGSRVTLRCSYDLEGAELYSIRWYRYQDEFYRYVPKESPPTMVFSLPGVHVDLSASNDQRVTLIGVHRQLTGMYMCEVSADAPLFHTEIQSTRLEIVDIPKSRPLLTVNRYRYSAGDNTRAHCSSPLSYPPANISWYLNGEKINKTFTTTLPLNPDLWEASSSLGIIEIGTEEQIHYPRYQVGGNQQETSSSQLKSPNSGSEITVYTAYSALPQNDKIDHSNLDFEKKFEPNETKVYRSGSESNIKDYPLRVSPVPFKITKIRMQPGFGGVLKLKCEATIYDLYKDSSEVVKVREETPHIALVMGQSSAGSIYQCFIDQIFYIVVLKISIITAWQLFISGS